MSLLQLVGGLVLLVAAGSLVVRASTDLGRRFGLSAAVIGLTIVAAGTSAPELAVVLQAVSSGDTELAVGSIIGSNIANILLVLGITATMGTIVVASRLVRTDIPVMIGASVTVLVLALDGRLGRIDGAVLVLALLVYVARTLRAASGRSPAENAGDQPTVSIPSAILRLGLGIGLLAVAARFVVGGAESLALSLGTPELVVGLTVVALGTSAPEIVTTLVAAFRGQRDLAVGNAVGSNIFNLLLVLGVAALVAADGVAFSDAALALDLPVMVAAAIACLPMVAWDHRLTRWEGVVFLAYYAAYVAYLALDATDHSATEGFTLVFFGLAVPLTVLTIAVVLVRQHRRRLATRPPKSRV